MNVKLTWTDNNTNETGHRVYRSSSPMDTQALPPPVADLGPDVTEWEDTDTPVDQEVHYIVSAVRGAEEAFSDETMIDTTTAEGDPHWDDVVALLNFVGPNGSQEFIDGTGMNTWTAFGNARIDTSQGYPSGLFPGASGDYISTPANSMLNLTGDFTIEVVLRPSLITQSSVLSNGSTGFGNAGSFALVLSHATSPNTLSVWNKSAADQALVEGFDMVVGDEYYIEVSRQGNTLRMFQDGILTGTFTTSQAFRLDMLGTRVGVYWGGPFNGVIRAVRVTNGVCRNTDNYIPPTVPFPNQ